MNDRNQPIQHIIDMARAISDSGQTGVKASKADAESVVRALVGGADDVFTTRYGTNYWNYLKAMLAEYVRSRGLEGDFVVKGSPFNWHGSVGTKCSSVILRKDFYRGDQRVEPELYLEVGLVAHQASVVPGVAFGFHYLPSQEGDGSRFVQGVLEDEGLRKVAWALSNNGFVNPTFRSVRTPFWNMEASLHKVWGEEEIPSDLEAVVFRTFDELLPLYRRVVTL